MRKKCSRTIARRTAFSPQPGEHHLFVQPLTPMMPTWQMLGLTLMEYTSRRIAGRPAGPDHGGDPSAQFVMAI